MHNDINPVGLAYLVETAYSSAFQARPRYKLQLMPMDIEELLKSIIAFAAGDAMLCCSYHL